ncbi:MAG TPA: hypothetical protein VE990_04975 [Acidimicrobiales bacterium]|nr:hypothetical protein [Acidimicrobiales bacterium]
MPRTTGRRLAVTAASAASMVGLTATMAMGASSSAPTVKSAHNASFGNILTTASGQSLYLLSAEGNGKFSCTGACVLFWSPLTVSSAKTKPTAGPGVAGKLGVVKNPEGNYQVTYNGYPVYTYLQDSGSSTSGEGVKSFGGTWYLMSAAATTPAATPVKHHT